MSLENDGITEERPFRVRTWEEAAAETGLDLGEYRHLYALVATYQNEEKKRLYANFEAKEVLDFLLSYIYAPPGSGEPGENIWTESFHAVYLDYHDRIDRVARNPLSVLKLGYGALFVETLGLMFNFYGLLNALDGEKTQILAEWLKGKKISTLKSIPPDLYGRAFVVVDPAGVKHRELVNLADGMLAKVVVVMNSPIALGTIQAGLSVLGKVAPARFKHVVPYSKKVVDKGQHVLKPYQHRVLELRHQMLMLEEQYISELLKEYGGEL